MHTILLVIQVLLAISIIALVLIQHGEGADAGAAFGSGASGTVFGSRGSANFLSRATGVLAALFFAASLSLAYLVHQGGSAGGSSVVDKVETHQSSPSGAAKKPQPGENNPNTQFGQVPSQQKPVQNPNQKPAQEPASPRGAKPPAENAGEGSNIPQGPPAGGQGGNP